MKGKDWLSLRFKNYKSNELNKITDEVNSSAIADTNIVKIVEYYNIQRLLDFNNNLKPYALFMANLIEAKDENAVKEALENVILPVGSSSIKKNTRFNVSIQSYLGAYYASNATPAVGAASDRFGVAAPIGISLTPSFLSFKKSGAISLFVSLFDLGAIVDYKLKQDSTSSGKTNAVTKSYSVKLGQIVSPGAYAVYGFFGNLPLSLGVGRQYGPGLAKIDAGGGQLVSPHWRWGAYLAVYLPLFTLKNANKTK